MAVPACAQSPSDAWAACNAAAAQAEREFGVPSGLLAAIGMVESGRWNAASRKSSPWPYAIDVGGYDLFMESLDAAAAKVRALQADGLRSIDVGCFQVNLMYHPDAFASIEDGFDPAANAAYAARFLLSLLQRTGSWQAAVAAYHSSAPGVGEPYRARVYASWSGEGDRPAAFATAPQTVTTMRMPARWGWAPVLSVRVIVPSAVTPLPAASGASLVVAREPAWPRLGAPGVSSLRQRGLPPVFTPASG